MTVLISLLLGIVQGIAEFLPISSSGHLSILQNIFGLNYSEEENLMFDVLLHVGTLISIIFVYRKEIRAMLSDGLEFLRARSDADLDEPVIMKPPARMLLFVIIGTIPLLLSLIFMGSVKRLFGYVPFIGFALIITGGLLFVSDRYIKKGNKTEKTMTLKDALLIGLAQAVAVVPGLSRSGATISVGLARGLDRNFAVNFSLLLSIPAVLGATISSLFSVIRSTAGFARFASEVSNTSVPKYSAGFPAYLIGFVFAAVVGFFAIQFMRRLMTKGVFGNFAYYCWGAGALAIILSLIL